MIRFILGFIGIVFLSPAFAAPFDAFDQAGIDRLADAHVPLDLAFQDENGRTVTLRDLGKGRPMLVVPVQHRCPNICGVTLGGLASAILAQPYRMDKDFVLVAFGIDPKETSADARASLRDLGLRLPELARADGLHAVTGTADAVKAVTDALGYRYAWDSDLGQYAHLAATAVLARDGGLSRWLYGIAPDPVDVRLALTEAGEGRIGHWSDQLLLLCYHYDPLTGRYGSLVWWLLRMGGALTVCALAGFMLLSLRRERRAQRLSP